VIEENVEVSGWKCKFSILIFLYSASVLLLLLYCVLYIYIYISVSILFRDLTFNKIEILTSNFISECQELENM